MQMLELIFHLMKVKLELKILQQKRTKKVLNQLEIKRKKTKTQTIQVKTI